MTSYSTINSLSLAPTPNKTSKAARIITNSSYDAPSLPLIRSLGWETIDDLINQEIKTTTFKSVNKLAPQYLIDLFIRNSNSSSHNLRNTDSYVQIPNKKTPNGQKCFSYRGAKVWNSLPRHAKQASSISCLKSMCSITWFVI